MKSVIKSLFHITSTPFEICWWAQMHLSEPALLECFGTPETKCILHQTALVHYISRAGFSAAKYLYDFKDAVLLYTS